MACESVTKVNSVMTVSQVLLNSALSWLTETDIFPEIYDRLKDSPTASCLGCFTWLPLYQDFMLIVSMLWGSSQVMQNLVDQTSICKFDKVCPSSVNFDFLGSDNDDGCFVSC